MTIEECRACGSPDLVEVLDLGEQHLSDFRDDDVTPGRWPLVLLLCGECELVQLSVTTPRELLYHDGYGFYSGVNEGIVRDLQDVVQQALRFNHDAESWLDIGCNDGTLLSFVPPGLRRYGVDPVIKFGSQAAAYATRVLSGYFNPDQLRGEAFDVITSVSMFYDLDDPNEFVDGVRRVLARDGTWVVQQNYLLAMLDANSVDNVCHEHVTYFALAPLMRLLQRHGLHVIDVSTSPVNGGSLRTVITRDDVLFPRETVRELLHREQLAGLDRRSTYDAFAGRATLELMNLQHLVLDAQWRGERIYIYGASTRGSTIWQAAGIDHLHAVVPCAVERNPAKVGKMYSALGIPIISEEQAREERPDYMLVGPWWFKEQIIEREREYLERGGKLIFPLPRLEVIEG